MLVQPLGRALVDGRHAAGSTVTADADGASLIIKPGGPAGG
ncbi:hypothetical protein ACQP1W_25450 [Spirillospora sp. CA-255316]